MSDDDTVIPLSRARALRALRHAPAPPPVAGDAPARDRAERARRLRWLRRKAALRGAWRPRPRLAIGD